MLTGINLMVLNFGFLLCTCVTEWFVAILIDLVSFNVNVFEESCVKNSQKQPRPTHLDWKTVKLSLYYP